MSDYWPETYARQRQAEFLEEARTDRLANMAGAQKPALRRRPHAIGTLLAKLPAVAVRSLVPLARRR